MAHLRPLQRKRDGVPCRPPWYCNPLSLAIDVVDARLRRLAAVNGKSQADLIREGVRRVIAEEHPEQRVFLSLGKRPRRGKAL